LVHPLLDSLQCEGDFQFLGF